MLGIGLVETSTFSVSTNAIFMGPYYWGSDFNQWFKFKSTHILNGKF